jgi:hypothetical protein
VSEVLLTEAVNVRLAPAFNELESPETVTVTFGRSGAVGWFVPPPPPQAVRFATKNAINTIAALRIVVRHELFITPSKGPKPYTGEFGPPNSLNAKS